MEIPQPKRPARSLPSPLVIAGAALVAAAAAAFVAGLLLPAGIDWHSTFRPAAWAVLKGQSPYAADLAWPYIYPPWAVIPLIPFSLLPENLGRGAVFVLGLAAYAYFAYRVGAKPLALGAFLASPPVLHCLLNANIDWMVLLGYVLPPQIGLFFLAIKPQIGIGGALFWLYASWKKGGWRETLRVFLPCAAALGLSFIVYGFWPLQYRQPLGYSWNASLWPLSIPVGLGLMLLSARRREIRYAMAASPCLSPYVLLHSWAGALGAVLADTPLALVSVAGLWIAVLVQAVK